MARYRPPTSLPTDPNQLAALLLEQFRRIAEDLGTIPTDDVNTVIVQERVDVPAGSTRRISPPTTGGIAVLEAPGPGNAGKRATIILENPAGELKVVASPHRAADGKITASTINGAGQATYTLPGVVTFTSNGVDSWKTQVETPAETAPTAAATSILDALDGTFHLQTADADLPNARVATNSDSIDVNHVTASRVSWDFHPVAPRTALGNDSSSVAIPGPVTVHQELDWIGSGGGEQWVFDGVNDQVSIGDFLDFDRLEPFSLSAWISTSSTAQQTFISKMSASPGFRGYDFGITNGQIFLLIISNFAVTNLIDVRTTSSVVAINTLSHVLVTYSGNSAVSGIKIYLDGAEVTSVTTGGTLSATTVNADNLALGYRPQSATSSLSGQMSNAAVFNYALTAAEVLEVFGGGSPPDLNALATAAPPVGWWRLDADDATGASGIIDYGSGGHDGTASGGLAPSSSIGSIITRGPTIWQNIMPGTDGLPLVSNGSAAVPGYEQLAMTATGALTGDVTKAAGSATTAIAAGVIVDADVNSSAAIAQTKLGATTGFSVKASGSAATTSAEPLVMYSASSNTSAERVTTTSTSITVSTSVANQIEFQRAALTGEVTAPANSNATAITRSTNFVWTGTHEFDNDVTFDDVVDVGHLWLTTGVFTLALSEGDNNDIAIGNVSVASFTTGVVNVLTGMVPAFDGQMVWIENSDNNASFSIAHDSTSTAANRFYCPHEQSLNVFRRTGVWARYNGTLSRWIIGDTKEFKGFNVRDTPSLFTGVGTLDIIEGNGITLTHASSGTAPSIELDITVAVNPADDFSWTGEHTYAESTNGPTVSAAQGAFWPRDDTPTQAMFTDDVGARWKLGFGCVSANATSPTATNATTNLSCGGSFNIPANTVRVGTAYRLHGQYVYVHTAAATPTLTFEVLVAGAVEQTVSLTPLSSASTYTGWFTAIIRFQTIGAGGAAMITWQQASDMATGYQNAITCSPHTATDAVDTTVSCTIELRCRMTTAVASNTLTVVQGFIERLA
jgi:hypothetical protein